MKKIVVDIATECGSSSPLIFNISTSGRYPFEAEAHVNNI
jgi:hypothetical protein